MKKLLVILTVVLFGCKPKPEFYINGKPYYTNTYCIKSHVETKTGFHVGVGGIPMEGTPMVYGEYEETICDEIRTDTIEIK